MRRALPLSSYGVLRTTDVDEARSCVGAVLAPHRLNPFSANGFRALHNVAQLGEVSLHYIDYTCEVEVSVVPMDFLLVEVPLAGQLTIATGQRRLVAEHGSATVTSWGQAHTRRCTAGNPRLMLQVESGMIAERMQVAQSAGVRLPGNLSRSLDLTRGRGRSWRNLLDAVIGDLDRQDGLVREQFIAKAWGRTLVDGLLVALADEEPAGPALAASEAVIRRAAKLIEDHCAEPLTTTDVAEAVGLSVRSLQEGFRRHLDVTPMTHLRQSRLRRVREALMDGSATSVTDAAATWGLTHLGRLSNDYRVAFGESPSQTLRRSRWG